MSCDPSSEVVAKVVQARPSNGEKAGPANAESLGRGVVPALPHRGGRRFGVDNGKGRRPVPFSVREVLADQPVSRAERRAHHAEENPDQGGGQEKEQRAPVARDRLRRDAAPHAMATAARKAQINHASAACRGSTNRPVPAADWMRVPAVRTPATAAVAVIASSSTSEVCVQNRGGSTPEITGRIVASRILCIILRERH